MSSTAKALASLLISTFLCGIGLQLSADADPSNANRSNSSVGQQVKPQENPSKVNRLPERLPGNQNTPVSKFLRKEYFQSQLRKDLGAELQAFEWMTYQDYIDKYTPGSTGITDISDDRVVAILEISFPKGLKAENADYSTAVVRSVRDAVSGELIEYEISGEVTDKNSLNRVIMP
ncbi:MAG: hypothetical protein HC851_04880 [Acaryochloris sp. RU_4_1]|nr:hypothetical protein [Acaryochloris sp. RU_4_1]NJR53837.1 hypothetical protein [Acaryochloris sp. CRU_2_0]